MNLHSNFKVLASRPGADAPSLASAIREFPGLPSEYADLVQEATELELQWLNETYLRIWGPSGCLEMDRAYEISSRIKGAIPIGDNGGGDAIAYMSGQDGWGLYAVAFNDVDREDARWIAPSLTALLVEGRGIEAL